MGRLSPSEPLSNTPSSAMVVGVLMSKSIPSAPPKAWVPTVPAGTS